MTKKSVDERAEEVRLELLNKASELLGKTETYKSTTAGIRDLVEAAATAFRAATSRTVTIDPPPDGGRALRGPKTYGDPPPDPG